MIAPVFTDDNPSPFMPVFAAPAITFARGVGTELYDTDGKRYLDFLGGLAVIVILIISSLLIIGISRVLRGSRAYAHLH